MYISIQNSSQSKPRVLLTPCICSRKDTERLCECKAIRQPALIMPQPSPSLASFPALLPSTFPSPASNQKN
jgi:hypothetical protein